VDELLSSEELLSVAEEESKQTQGQLQDLVFGLLDCASALLFFLPLFGQNANGAIHAVPLLSINEMEPWLKSAYVILTVCMVFIGILTLALQNCRNLGWHKSKSVLSLVLHTLAILLFILGRQPYASVFLFAFLMIKVFLPIKIK